MAGQSSLVRFTREGPSMATSKSASIGNGRSYLQKAMTASAAARARSHDPKNFLA